MSILLSKTKPQVPASIEAKKLYGINRSEINHLMINQFHIPQDLRFDENSVISSYYMLYWSGAFFCSMNHNGVVHSNGTDYIVVFHHCSPHAVRKARQVKLSFRKAKPEFNLPAYVLVTVDNLEVRIS